MFAVWWLLGALLGILLVLIIAFPVKAVYMILKSLRLSRIPVETVTARIIRRRTAKVPVLHPNGREIPGEFRTACFASFEDTDGKVRELEVTQDFYSAFREGTCGELVLQGETFLSFTPQLLPEVRPEEPDMPAEVPAVPDFDTALFERRYPEQEQSGQEQLPMC